MPRDFLYPIRIKFMTTPRSETDRIQELLEANNRLLQRARDAESIASAARAADEKRIVDSIPFGENTPPKRPPMKPKFDSEDALESWREAMAQWHADMDLWRREMQKWHREQHEFRMAQVKKSMEPLPRDTSRFNKLSDDKYTCRLLWPRVSAEEFSEAVMKMQRAHPMHLVPVPGAGARWFDHKLTGEVPDDGEEVLLMIRFPDQKEPFVKMGTFNSKKRSWRVKPYDYSFGAVLKWSHIPAFD